MARRIDKFDLDIIVGEINRLLPEGTKITLDFVVTQNTLGWRVLHNGQPLLFTEEVPARKLYEALCYFAAGASIATLGREVPTQ